MTNLPHAFGMMSVYFGSDDCASAVRSHGRDVNHGLSAMTTSATAMTPRMTFVKRSRIIISSLLVGERCSRRGEHRLHERPCLWGVPVARPDDAAAQPSTLVDEVHGGRAPYPIDTTGHVAALVEEDGRRVAALLHRALHRGRALAKAHEHHGEASRLEFVVESVDGRQLLPAIG